MDFVIEVMKTADWGAVQAIYWEGIESGQATFETAVPAWEVWDSSHLRHSRLVARTTAGVVGWAALTPVSSRCVYEGVAEVSVYIAAAARGQGVGKALLGALVAASEQEGIWTLQSSLFPENEASVAIHRANGFRIVGRRERVAQQYGVWRDTLIMERRSSVVGQA